MSVTDYTSYDSVRAVLGVTDLELPDVTLGLPLFSHKLDKALSSVSGVYAPDTEERTLAGHYTYINGLEAPTDDQALLFGLIAVYSTYLVGAAAGGSLSMLAPKTISDGKALRTRFSAESTFQDTMRSVYNELQSTKQAILEYLDEDFTSGLTYVGRVEPDEDLVTNE